MAAAALRAELAELVEQRSAVEARLRQSSGASVQGRGSHGALVLWQRAPYEADQHAARRPQLSSVVVPVSADGDAARAHERDAAPEPDEARGAAEPSQAPASLKRPLRTEADNPALRKRNQRMFGALMGTLQKFRQEEGTAATQEVTAKRSSALQRAEEREREESRRLRERERGEQGARRRSELLLQHRLGAEMAQTQLRLAHATWLEHHARCRGFLLTAAAPPLLFLPAKLCDAASTALAARREAAAGEVEQAEARLAEALAAAAAAAAALEAELTGRGEPDAAAEGHLADAQAAPVVADAPPSPMRDEDAELEEAAGASPPAGLAAVLGGSADE